MLLLVLRSRRGSLVLTVEADRRVRPEGVLIGTTSDGDGDGLRVDSAVGDCGRLCDGLFDSESGVGTALSTAPVAASAKAAEMAAKSATPSKNASTSLAAKAGNSVARWARRAARSVKGKAVAARKRANLASESMERVNRGLGLTITLSPPYHDVLFN